MTMIPQQIVKEKWPEAFVDNIDYGFGIFTSEEKLSKWEALGVSKFDGATIEAAWENALKNLGDE